MTVRVNDVIGVAGFALPGNYVDILVNTQRDNDNNLARDKEISKIVLERILVLAVAQDVGRDETKPRVVNAVTLEVTPEQAEKLDLARSVGSLSLVLRNQMDPLAASTEGAMKSSLLAERVPPSALQKINNALVVPAPIRTKPKQAVKPKTVEIPVPQDRQLVETKIAPEEKPAVSNAAATSEAVCIGVINGLRNSTECY